MSLSPHSQTKKMLPLSFLLPLIVLSTSTWCCRGAAAAPADAVWSTATPVSLRRGLHKALRRRWRKAAALAELEQSVDDYNAEWIASSSSAAQAARHRRLLCLPLDQRFDPPMGRFSHGHVQTGDKMSVPPNFGAAIALNRAEVPYLLSVKRLDHHGVTQPRVALVEEEEEDGDGGEAATITPLRPLAPLDAVVGSVLDVRAPSCYIMVPLWMMRALGVRPLDVVQVDLVEEGAVAPGSQARLRPHSGQFARELADPQAVLETELRHYSSLTQGSTIAFDYNHKRYWFDVVELRSAPRGEKQPMIKVQDCDITTDFLPARDTLKRPKQRPKKGDDDGEEESQ